jgi:hypothetical protein
MNVEYVRLEKAARMVLDYARNNKRNILIAVYSPAILKFIVAEEIIKYEGNRVNFYEQRRLIETMNGSRMFLFAGSDCIERTKGLMTDCVWIHRPWDFVACNQEELMVNLSYTMRIVIDGNVGPFIVSY